MRWIVFPARWFRRRVGYMLVASPTQRRWFGALLGLSLATLATLALSGCSSSSGTASETSTPAPSATHSAPASTQTPTTSPGGNGSYAVKVFFSRHPDSDNDPSKVFAVARSSPTLQVATYAIQQLIAGPTTSEQSSGYYTELQGALSGASNCGGADFTITLDHRGSHAETGTATLQFCRQVLLPGDLTGPRIKAEINATLTQFSSTQQVTILTETGSCFDDLSGQNLCLS